MAANTAPIFALTPNAGVAGVLLTTAMTNTKAFDGTEAAGTAMALVYTAGANGSRVDKIKIRFTSTAGATASGTTAANLVRIWMNNNSTNTTASNNILLKEVALPATTVTALGTTELPEYVIESADIPTLPASYRIYAGTTVAVGGTNCAVGVAVFGGDY